MRDTHIIESPQESWPPQFQSAGALRREWQHLQRLAAIAGLDDGQVIMPSRGYQSIVDLNLHYVDWPSLGATAGDILFLHGGALQARTWDAVCLFLRDSYHCTALDLRGHGESDWSPEHDYALSSHAADIAQFIARRQLKQVTLVGHSLGGLAAMLVAAMEATSVAALVLVDIAPSTNPQATGRVRDFIRSQQGFASADELLEHVLKFAPRRRKELLAGSLVHNIQTFPDGTLAWKYDPSQFSSEHDRPSEEELWECVARIPCPILLVRGTRSRVVSPETAERLVTQARNGRACCIEGAGHTVQGDAPRELAATIREFVSPGSS
jgi:esterase